MHSLKENSLQKRTRREKTEPASLEGARGAIKNRSGHAVTDQIMLIGRKRNCRHGPESQIRHGPNGGGGRRKDGRTVFPDTDVSPHKARSQRERPIGRIKRREPAREGRGPHLRFKDNRGRTSKVLQEPNKKRTGRAEKSQPSGDQKKKKDTKKGRGVRGCAKRGGSIKGSVSGFRIRRCFVR